MTVHVIAEVVLDCSDPRSLSDFYVSLLGGRERQRRAEWCSIWADPLIIGFQRVPEGKVTKNRCHLDFHCDDLRAAVDRAVALGATMLGDVVHEQGGSFIVLADPEGNEFCFVHGYPDDPELRGLPS